MERDKHSAPPSLKPLQPFLHSPHMYQVPQDAANPGATVLVVDDTPELRQLLSEILQEAGYVVLVAVNGRVALEALAAQSVDLILFDILMPDLNGVAILSAIRARSDVPVIMLSAVSNATIQAKLSQLGILTYVTKPFRLQALLDTIEMALQETGSHRNGPQSCQTIKIRKTLV